jgi:predicted nuclease of predicted toxin-antitoxin system
MLSLLLDENLSPEVAKQIVEKRPDISIMSVHHWHEGRYKAERDEAILLAAASEEKTLVTYDQKTILPILMRWGQTEVSHAGVIFVDDRTIASNNFGALVRSLIAHWNACHEETWTNRVDFLRAEIPLL